MKLGMCDLIWTSVRIMCEILFARWLKTWWWCEPLNLDLNCILLLDYKLTLPKYNASSARLVGLEALWVLIITLCYSFLTAYSYLIAVLAFHLLLNTLIVLPSTSFLIIIHNHLLIWCSVTYSVEVFDKLRIRQKS